MNPELNQPFSAVNVAVDLVHDRVLVFGSFIEILSPHYYAIRDANELTIPPENIPEGHENGGFRLWVPARFEH